MIVICQDCSGYPGLDLGYTALAIWEADFGGIDFGTAPPGDQFPPITKIPESNCT